MQPVALVVHGHFYQPPRENPWTEETAREPSAAPFHDWNARIASESYRPNAYARVIDERGLVVSIVNNYEHLSFDVGPTLTGWLAEHEPDTWQRVLDGDAKGGGGMAQAYFHVILPLATERDVRTHVRWGMAEFEHRFGRPAEGIWLPETAVNEDVLRVLAEEGVAFTVLAPSQGTELDGGPVDVRKAYRWHHPAGDGRGLDLVFYDGALSHAVAFELGSLSSSALLDRVQAASSEGGLVALAADGETFGHHAKFADRLIAHALTTEAPARGVEVTTVAAWLRANPPEDQACVVESAWSCAHGVGRWKTDCGCSTGGEPGWTQEWRGPLREALDVVRDAVDEVFERRGRHVLRDPWAARDAYISVLLGSSSRDEFAERHVTGDPLTAFTLLEAARHSLAMYTSCGWFFNDLAGLETVQIMRYAARALDLLEELGEQPPTARFLDVLACARSNIEAEGDGRSIWERHVEPARVGADRVVAHLALVELLEEQAPAARIGAYDVEVLDHDHTDAGVLALSSGHVVLTHRRTGRRSEHVYAALHLGALEVLGATRPADPARDEVSLSTLRAAFAQHAAVTTLLRMVSDLFGPHEFSLRDGLPDAAEQILHGAARSLADRFAGAYERLFSDHRPTLTALAAAGYEMPPELRAPAELALARRLEAEVEAQRGSLDPADYGRAVAIAREASEHGFTLDTPSARARVEGLLLAAVEAAVADPAAAGSAIQVLRLADQLGVRPSFERAQERVHDAVAEGDVDERLLPLAYALGIAVSS